MATAFPYWTTNLVPVAAPTPHFAASFAGGAYLSGPTSGHFAPAGPKNVVAAAWVRLQSKVASMKIMAVTRPGGGGVAGDDVLGVFYNQGVDAFEVYASSGVGYTLGGTLPVVNPVLNTWYLLVAEFAGFSLTLYVTDPAGAQAGGTTGFGGVYNAPGSYQFTLGNLPNGINTSLIGDLDSVQYWNSTRTVDFPNYFTVPPPGDIWNGGKALNFSELPASAPPTTVLQAYLDFNEATGAPSYADVSPNAFTLLPAGGGTITRITGAGY